MSAEKADVLSSLSVDSGRIKKLQARFTDDAKASVVASVVGFTPSPAKQPKENLVDVVENSNLESNLKKRKRGTSEKAQQNNSLLLNQSDRYNFIGEFRFPFLIFSF